MKIKNVDKETKKSNKEYLLPIAKAGLGLGITAALINTGVVDYDAMLNWDSMSDFLDNLSVSNIPGLDINTAFNIVKTAVTTFGMNTLIIAGKGFNLAKEAIKPIVESEKVKNNPTVLKIKEVFKGKAKDDEKSKYPKALLNLAKNGLSLGFKAYMIATGQIDYNSVYDFTKLPHKFAGLAQIAQSIDLNKLKIGMDSLKIVPKFLSERKTEKEEGLPLIKPISFKDIFGNISKFPTSTRVSDLDCVKNMGQGKVEPSKPIIEGER